VCSLICWIWIRGDGSAAFMNNNRNGHTR
jgi:hypothetical protein